MDPEEGWGGQPRLDVLKGLNVPDQLHSSGSDEAVVAFGFDVEDLIPL
jgi:hypothetical protein